MFINNQIIISMKYFSEIAWYLTLPLTIAIAYYAVLWGLKIFERKFEIDDTESSD